MLDTVNPLTKAFCMAQERIKQDKDIRLSIRLIATRQITTNQYNSPTSSEIAALIVGDIGMTLEET